MNGRDGSPYLPQQYFKAFLTWLRHEEYNIITYDDLAFAPRVGETQQEFRAWQADPVFRDKKNILLQYDVDGNVSATNALVAHQIKIGVPSNVMIFNQRTFSESELGENPWRPDPEYKIDYGLFKEFEAIGGVVGYHSNAYERANFDVGLALEYFEEDVCALRNHFELKYFSMHGGRVTPDGMRNASLPVHDLADNLGITWVHNGHSVHFHRAWADGGLSSGAYRGEINNLMAVVSSTTSGQRTRLLVHPQYYHGNDRGGASIPVIGEPLWLKSVNSESVKKKPNWLNHWKKRYREDILMHQTYDKYLERPAGERAVFVNGMSRSGTTLLTAMFDAHKDGAMAYESYPHYLFDKATGKNYSREKILHSAQALRDYPEKEAFEMIRDAGCHSIITFAAVSNWTGMTTKEVGELLLTYLKNKIVIRKISEALEVVAASCRYKMEHFGGSFWGSKCDGQYAEYFKMADDVSIIYIMRDGLDILASQKTTGAFAPEAEKIGLAWKQQYHNFYNFKKAHPELKCFLIKYESLVQDPAGTLESLCEKVGLDFDQTMAAPHTKESTLMKNPRGQLSVERIKQPVDASAIGRWKSILEPEDVELFLKGCGGIELYERRGYRVS